MAPLPSSTWCRGIALGLALGCGAALPASANPDVWVKIKYLLTFNDTALTGLDIDWTFDPFLSSWALEQFDSDEDGAFSAEETTALRAQLFDTLADQSYFVQVLAGETSQVMGVERFAASVAADQIVLAFTLVPETPIDYRAAPVTIGTYDDEIFFDFTLADEAPLRVDGPFDAACRFRVQAGEGALDGASQAVVLLCGE